MSKPTIYIVSDGKPGHLAQSDGLAEAIGRLIEINIEQVELKWIHVTKRAKPYPKGNGLILAAGRNACVLARDMKKQFGLPAIALMNPGWLNRKRFDLCVIPRHDGIAESDKIIVTEGALNGLVASTNALVSEGLMLIGGPSKHHAWDSDAIGKQLTTILERDPQMRWTVTGSRRTPDSTDRLLHDLAKQFGDRFAYTPASQTPRGWVAEQLARCGVCWVSEDSVSMVYEALTAGARVGLLRVPRKGKPGRVVRGVQSLVDRGWVTSFDQWQDGQLLSNDREPLAEADRVAKLVLERFPALTQ